MAFRKPGWELALESRFSHRLHVLGGSLVAEMVKNPPAMWETWIHSQGWEDPLEEGMQPTPVFLPRESSWTEEPGELQSISSQSQT